LAWSESDQQAGAVGGGAGRPAGLQGGGAAHDDLPLQRVPDCLRETMKLTVISLPYSAERGFDAAPLEAFCEAHAVNGWVDHFFVHAGRPELVVVIEYEECAGIRRAGKPQRRERDPRRELPAMARPAYDRLREWRSLRARQDGVPVYVVFSNRELAAIAAAAPRTKEALRAIDGIGKGKVDKYTEDVFEVLASLTESGTDQEARSPDEPC